MSEVSDACQIVMISGKMIAVSASLSLKLAMLMIKIYNSIYLGKWKGKTAFQRFRAIKGDDYEFINICSENPEKLAAIEHIIENTRGELDKLADVKKDISNDGVTAIGAGLLVKNVSGTIYHTKSFFKEYWPSGKEVKSK